ncbi:MAG: hypothetical protein A2161_11815 [Candidatus Schekmanbacteria bacterium RBG_13_48_7]|uniref:Exopolyphosphatase n=1 Tax=Candidatus Schekmanbacteria bacterium RBG_13_48_7 TaxID=1817878 RepID=A0A1F7RLT9_9BACT|nr:MAG: hypothetical protein A2161_11815 [Candidatus Schekmanbacteria bacterium RBG_13_48_7]
MIERIITHNDFDGIVSAAICMCVFDLENVFFAGPSKILENRIQIFETDVVCDLPYATNCGMWFDHHEGNLNDVHLRGFDPTRIPGLFAPEKSCARVVYNYFLTKYELPEDFIEMVVEADRIDSFGYQSIDEWRLVTPAHIINDAIKAKWENPRQKNRFLYQIVTGLCDSSLETVSQDKNVQKSWKSYREEEDRMLELIKERSYIHETDPEKEILIIDLTDLKRQPFVIKNLAYLIYPEVLAVIQIQNLYQNNVKSNVINFSMSLSIKMNNREHWKDIGEIMRSLNIGDGHSGAASGLITADSKSDLEKTKQNTLLQIINIWKKQIQSMN